MSCACVQPRSARTRASWFTTGPPSCAVISRCRSELQESTLTWALVSPHVTSHHLSVPVVHAAISVHHSTTAVDEAANSFLRCLVQVPNLYT